jgi:fructan beta-fructosidase
MRTALSCMIVLSALGTRLPAAEDMVIADFEGPDYGAWKATGDAFGAGPAHGTLPNQQPVSGFLGKGLVNTYRNGDKPTGRLSSPEWTIERKYVNFLIGGGSQPGHTCINLLVDGKAVRTATGADNERLDWATWDVADLAEKKARIEIVDDATDGWGHVNVDQIVLSDRPQSEPVKPEKLYDEHYRPQFHFSPRTNWTNDPNGMLFYGGEYHLFFQHNPLGLQWGNMTWGHAVSPDMLHWTQLEHAIRPDRLGTIFSGSAVVDGTNTAGFQTGHEKVIVCIFTSAGNTSPESKGQAFTQSIAYSNDRGRTWKKYEHNPVLKHIAGDNRDPKVFWHEPTQKWIMALFLDGSTYALFASPNLKQWTKLCDVPMPDCSECPDCFPLPIDGDAKNVKWVFWSANNKYVLGRFDGTTFHREAGPIQTHWGRNRYASQTFSDVPPADGRRIQIAWMNGGQYPGMPFNQQMSFPVKLRLRTFPEGVRLCASPVEEIDRIHGRLHSERDTILRPGNNPLDGAGGELFDIRLEIIPGSAQQVGLKIRGVPIQYDAKAKSLSCLGTSATVEPADGKIGLQVLVDRSSIEIFTADGRVNMAYCFLPPASDKSLAVFAQGGEATIRSLDVWELKSTWPR